MSFCRFAEILLCEPFEGSGCNNRHKLARTKGTLHFNHTPHTHTAHKHHTTSVVSFQEQQIAIMAQLVSPQTLPAHTEQCPVLMNIEKRTATPVERF